MSYDYSGICARTYDLLISTDEIGDFDFYRDGLDVDGVDISPEMLEICRRKLFGLGLQVHLFQQPMQELRLDRRYRTIFVPAASIMLLEADEARQALGKFREHLAPDGAVIIPLILPDRKDFAVEAATEGKWRLRRENLDPETGAQVRCWELAHYDFPNQTKHVQCRYEILHGDHRREVQMYRLRLRWYTQCEFREMLEEGGFREVSVLRGHTFEPAVDEDAFFTFVAEFR